MPPIWRELRFEMKLFDAPIFRISMEVSNSWPAAIKSTTTLMPEWRVGSVSKAFPYLMKRRQTEIPLVITNTRTHTDSKRQMLAMSVPAAGLVPAALITEARAHEHVLVDPSTQAVNVWRHLVLGLHQRQNQLQSLGPVSGVIPPDRARHFFFFNMTSCKSLCPR